MTNIKKHQKALYAEVADICEPWSWNIGRKNLPSRNASQYSKR